MWKKRTIWMAGALIFLFLAVELAGRYYGLCTFPLMVLDPAYEYAAAPNQDLLIFRNRFRTNAYSMRSKPLSKEDKIRLLLIGDSILFGGNHTCNDSLASSLLENQLRAEFGLPIRVLNVSAGSWGPDNGAAFLRKHGHFDAEMMLGVYSSHDALDVMTFMDLENHPELPTEQAPLAWVKLWKKWLSPRLFGSPMDKVTLDHMPTYADLNPGFAELKEIADSLEIPFFLYLHAEQGEIETQRFNLKGRWILQYLEESGISYATDLERGITKAAYRDIIHLNDQGHRFLAQQLYPILAKRVRELISGPTVPATESL